MKRIIKLFGVIVFTILITFSLEGFGKKQNKKNNIVLDDINIISEYIDQANIIIRDFCELNFENLMSRYNN